MLSTFSKYVVYDLFKLSQNTHFSGVMEFFVYDIIKIFILLSVIIFAISFVRSFFTPEKTRNILSHKKEFIGNILASLLGVGAPFCSCSAVPLFIGFVEGGVPLGVTFSFLISSPMVNELAIVLLFGLFGWKITAIYIGTGFLVSKHLMVLKETGIVSSKKEGVGLYRLKVTSITDFFGCATAIIENHVKRQRACLDK